MAEELLIAVAAVVVIACAGTLGRKLNVATPLILVSVGVVVSLLPFVHIPQLDPEIILVGILPPLLYSAAVSLPAIEFRRDFGPIAGLSVVLVVISALVLGLVFSVLIPGLGLPLSFALGAILSPTDAVATSIVKKLGISRRVVTLLEGESLLNDATSLVILRTAVAAFFAGTATFGGAVGAFVWGSIIAVIVGVIVGLASLRLRALVHNSAATTAIGFVVPFAAFAPTEMLGGSGLVAAVAAGITMGQGSARWATPEQRLSDKATWQTIELVLEGAVFLIMGLELKEIIEESERTGQGVGGAALFALIAFGLVMVVRAAYVSLIVWAQSRRAREKQRERLEEFGSRLEEIADSPDFTRKVPRALRHGSREAWLARARIRIQRGLSDIDYFQASPLGWRNGTIIVWAGMRGVVTLAAAQTLPRETPERPTLILVAFLVAAGSLLLQGLTLPALVRALGLQGSGASAVTAEEQERLNDQLRDAAASALTSPTLRRDDGTPFAPDLVQDFGAMYTEPPDSGVSVLSRERIELRLALIGAMRVRLQEVSVGGEYSTPALRHSLAMLDADELSLRLQLDDAG